MYFYKQNIRLFRNFLCMALISELEAICIFNLRGQKPYHDGHTDIMVEKYSSTSIK